MPKLKRSLLLEIFLLAIIILLGTMILFWHKKNDSFNYLCLNNDQQFVLVTADCHNGECKSQERDGAGVLKLDASYDFRGGLYNNDLFDTAHSWCVKISKKDAQNFSSQFPQQETFENSTTYQEYPFYSDDRQLNFTYRALEKIRASQSLLDNGMAFLSDGEEIKYLQTTVGEQQRGVMEKRSAGNDIYELASENNKIYSVFKNGALLFEKPMEFGTEGPILDWRIVDDKPAFTYMISCTDPDQIFCGTEIFYDGKFLSQKYDVKNPRYLFSYQHKLGFVVSDEDGDKIFFDGSMITPAFETIFTHNCCALTEILPIVYNNGVLLFYGVRNSDQDYLVEVLLP